MVRGTFNGCMANTYVYNFLFGVGLDFMTHDEFIKDLK